MAHSQQDTTGACEGFHSALKASQLVEKSRLGGRRVDWLLKVLSIDVRIRSLAPDMHCHLL